MHLAQLMLLPLTVVPDKGPLNVNVCLCVCLCVLNGCVVGVLSIGNVFADRSLSVSKGRVFEPGIVDHIDYVPGSGRQPLSRNASLQLCDDAACKPTRVTVTVKLNLAEDSDSKCEVDIDSIAARNQLCGT